MSTAHTTQAFLNDLDTGTTWEAIYDFDMYHAFDSPPKILISEVLERMGTPLTPRIFWGTKIPKPATVRNTTFFVKLYHKEHILLELAPQPHPPNWKFSSP